MNVLNALRIRPFEILDNPLSFFDYEVTEWHKERGVVPLSSWKVPVTGMLVYIFGIYFMHAFMKNRYFDSSLLD
jgi:hypothetical protein